MLKSEIAQHIWETKYRFKKNGVAIDHSIQDTWQRVARALASAEPQEQMVWEERFYKQLEGFRFLPAGRILAGAGTERAVTLFNCFVMGEIEDSIASIFENIKEGAVTMQWGGGIGYDFSSLRPKGTQARSTNNISSGPVSFMKVWDAMCATMMSTGARRGAMMGTLRCDHPDILEFITAKQEPGTLTNFNLSVLVSDEFMEAVNKDEEWHLVFPILDLKGKKDINDGSLINRRWNHTTEPVACRIFKTVRAHHLWEAIMKSNYEHAEPGVLFIDRINEMNNMGYQEYITCTNPCGEVPLPPYGACNLGSVNLTQFVHHPFTPKAVLNTQDIMETVTVAVRMLDNVTTVSRFPLKKQATQVRKSRRIGIGITGLADALVMLNVHYGSEKGRSLAAGIMKEICYAAYRASMELAKEKGAFPSFDSEAYSQRPFIRNLPESIRRDINKFGIRNSHLLSIAPTGSISLLAGNISSGLEPIFDFEYTRGVLNTDGSPSMFKVQDYAYRLWNRKKGDEELPQSFVKATELTPEQHLKMQAALQQHVDNSISKTINIPKDFSYSSFKKIYENAYNVGVKGCTTFQPSSTRGAVLSAMTDERRLPCCTSASKAV